MGVRRNASLHQRSSTIMMRNNKTSHWMRRKSAADAAKLFAFARPKGRMLRARHKVREQLVRLKLSQKLAENRRKKAEKEAKAAQQKADLMQRVGEWGVPCQSAEDVRKFVRRIRDSESPKVAIEAIKDQIRYQKVILGHKGLKLSGSFDELVGALKAHLGTSQDTQQLSESESDDDSEPETKLPRFEFDINEPIRSFQFSKQEWVAVYWDDDVHIGQVINFENENKGNVKFLKKAESKLDKNQLFTFNDTDIRPVSAHYVIHWDFQPRLIGRRYIVDELAYIRAKYLQLKEEDFFAP